MQEKEGNILVSFPTLQVLDVGGATSDSCADSLPKNHVCPQLEI